MLHHSGFVRCGHIQVGHDERVAVHGVEVGELGDRQGPLLRAQGPAAPGAGVGGDLPGGDVEADPADQQPGRRGPPVWGVLGDGDLRAVHVDRVGPVGLGDTAQDPPQRGDAFGADGELDTGEQRGPGQFTGEVASISAQPHPSGAGPGGQRRQRPAQQLGGVPAGSSLPAIRSAANVVTVSAQVATCGRPQRCPW